MCVLMGDNGGAYSKAKNMKNERVTTQNNGMGR
jgi:hypothetical protein